MAFRTANAKQSSGNGGEKWTDEQRAAYQAQQDAGWANFVNYYRGKGAKARVSFLARVLEFSDEPYEVTETIEGVTKSRMVSDVKVELTQPGVEGLRFVMKVTDNPNTIQNGGSALNHLYTAATHRAVPEHGRFTWDPEQDLIGKDIFAVIQRGNPRTDGVRGGFWSELKDFEELVPEETPAPKPTPARAKKVATPKSADPETPAAAGDYDPDDVPF